MQPVHEPPQTGPDEGITSLPILLARLLWAFFGPAVLAITGMCLAGRNKGWFTGMDIFFWAVLAVMVLGRWIEHRSGQARTAKGEPATARDLRRYYVILLPTVASLWLVLKLIGRTGWIQL